MADAFSLQVPATLSNLTVIRHFIIDEATALGVEKGALEDVVQAVDELATNIIMHGYRGQPGTIEVQIRRDTDRLIVLLKDQAPAFDPTLAPLPDLTLPLDERPLGKLGIFLARKLMDEIAYRAPPQGGNELTLTKKLTITRPNF